MKELIRIIITVLAISLGMKTAMAGGLPFETRPVTLEDVQTIRLFEGTVEAVNKATISAQTSGRIAQVNFDVDDFVQAGEVIVRFYDREHKSAVAQAKSALAAARARRIAAQQEFTRIKKLFASGTVARARFDTSKSNYDSALANEERAKAALAQATEQLSYTVVRAPYSGIVVQRHVEIGETANPGQPLMTGFSLEKLRVRVDVPEQYAGAIRKHNSAMVLAGHKAVKPAAITVFPFADPKSNTVTVRLMLPAKIKDILPGMLVKVSFATGRHKALLINRQAVVRRGELTGAYLVRNNRLHLQQIRTGRAYENGKIEVLSGLTANDTVALDTLKAAIYIKQQRDAGHE